MRRVDREGKARGPVAGPVPGPAPGWLPRTPLFLHYGLWIAGAGPGEVVWRGSEVGESGYLRPMRYNPQLLDEIRARLPVSQVVSRKVPLKRKGREYSGLSPFKTEKTASFFVNDQKGFYHCFASGEHGDIFTFVMKTEGLSFPEAVERLAAEAGVALPAPDARDEERADERQRLLDLMQAAAEFFITALAAPAGTDARRYIAEKRGLARETVQRFRIGYAPNSKSALREHLAKAGYTVEEMVKSGMLIGGDDIPVAYDRFRNRVMFPITDLKGRTIAFGGRALDPDQPAKYLNSPETPLFHKGHVLFNASSARQPAHDKHRVIAVEGYMDVVALAEAGFGESVAPLGTALTEDQVKLLWRMVPEPTLCFDGDSAGKKAAFRAIDTALPHLKPGYSVQFAFLPDGLDPDDLIRQQGAAAMEAALAAARPLVDVLWEREWQSGDWTTPERRARLEAQLRALVARIEDASVRGHYEREVRRRLTDAFGGPPPEPARAPAHYPADTDLSGPLPDVDGYDDRGRAPDGRSPDWPGDRWSDRWPSEQDDRAGTGGASRRASPVRDFGGGAGGGHQGGRGGRQGRSGQHGMSGSYVSGSGNGGGPFRRRSWPPSPYDPVPHANASPALRRSTIVAASAGPGAERAGGRAGAPAPLPPREVLLLRTLLNHPWLADDHAEEIAALQLTSTALCRLRDAILSLQALDNSLDREGLRSQLSRSDADQTVKLIDAAVTHRSDRFSEPDSERTEVEAGWRHALVLHERQIGLRRSLAAAERAWHETGSEEAQELIFEHQRQLALLAAPEAAEGADGSAEPEFRPPPGLPSSVHASSGQGRAGSSHRAREPDDTA